MQRAISVALSIAAVVLSAVLAVRSGASAASPAAATASTVQAAPTSPSDAGARDARGADAGAGRASGAEGSARDADIAFPDLAPPLAAVPPVETGAPTHVRFGVVLVTYEGTEGAPEKGARPRSDALALATKLADEAKGDFHATVAHGDPGSTDDVGVVGRGVLEPSSEAVLFALPVGGVSGVIDTPKGFWIVKRLD